MNQSPIIERLQALKRSLEVARDVKHDIPECIRDMHVSHIKGLTAGLQIAIDAIESELRMILAGQATGSVS